MTAESSSARVLCAGGRPEFAGTLSAALGARVAIERCETAAAVREALAREPAQLVVATSELAAELAETGTPLLVQPDGLPAEWLVAAVARELAHRRAMDANARLRSEVGLLESCRMLLHCVDPGEVYAVALDLLLPALSRDQGLAIFRRSSMPGSDGIAFRGFDEDSATELQRRMSQDKPDADFYALREPASVSGGPIGAALEELGVGSGSALVVPLRGDDTEEGLLWIPELGRPSSEEDLESARRVARYAELALTNAERYLHAKERAFIDDVTEVYNARYLLQATEHEIRRAQRSGKELSVLFLDLDRFKRVNDQFGHLVGSNTLRQLSQVLLECIRQVDTLARYGGDEFTILLVDTGHDDSLAVAERIRRTVAETLFEGAGGAPIRLTISIGVATFPDHGDDRENLLDLADKAMYRAKSLGRNCVCSAADLAR